MIKFLFITVLLPVFCCGQSVNNLDVKNGFLQFKLGDTVFAYASMVNLNKRYPNRQEVKFKFIKLKKHLDRVELIFENNTLTSIEIYIRSDDDQRYIYYLLKQAYGDGTTIDNGTSDEPGVHNTFIIWNGTRVAAILKKRSFNLTINGQQSSSSYETLTIKKTSNNIVNGELPADFPL
ncbi:MAG: hypothetical protein JWP94_300 [Mucilaginibacter sp.]|nr:hypothetical protein [Mucilaginibacter sp.]